MGVGMNILSPRAPSGEPQPFKLRVEDYELLERAGAFNGARVELIEGMVVEISSQQRPHSFTKNELSYRLRRALEAMDSPLRRKPM
jgi:hypothetical protein